MNTFHLRIASADGNIFDGEAISISLRGTEGDLAILAGHAPFVTTVKPCECKIVLPDSTEKTGSTEGGLLTVSDNSAVLLSGSFKLSEN